MRKSALVAAFVLPLTVSACSDQIHSGSWFDGNTVKGSGKGASEDRKVAAFKGVEVASSGSVEIKVGGPQKITVEIDDNLLPLITTEVRNGVLHIGSKGYSTKHGLKVAISVPSLESSELTGSGDIRVQGIKGPSFRVTLSGSGEIEASGTVDKLESELSGSGDLRLTSLRARETDVNVSGSGNALVYASTALDASITGSGNVECAGNPSRVSRNITGSGEVSVGK